MVAYYLTLFLIAFYKLIDTIKNLRFNLGFNLVKSSVIIYFLLFMIVAYFIPMAYVESTKIFTFLILLIVFILKFTPENFSLLFYNQVLVKR